MIQKIRKFRGKKNDIITAALSDYNCRNKSQLEGYPCLSFEQGDNGSFYFAEKILATNEYSQVIRANARATILQYRFGMMTRIPIVLWRLVMWLGRMQTGYFFGY